MPESSHVDGIPLGRSGPVVVAHMVAPGHADKTALLNGQAVDGQCVSTVLLDSTKPLAQQWKALRPEPHLNLFKLHSAMAAPDTYREFLAGFHQFHDSHRTVLESTAIIPLAADRMLADRFTMMGLLKRVCEIVSHSTGQLQGCCLPGKEASRASDRVVPRCAIPVFHDVCQRDFTGSLPPFMEYPVVMKPRDSSDHSQMALVFDELGLRSCARRLSTDFRVEQFVSHGGRVHKVFVVGDEIYVGERKSLPDMSRGCDPAALVELAASIDGKYEHGEGGAACKGYVIFDSAVLTKGKEKNGSGLAPAKRLDQHDLDSHLIAQLRDTIAAQVGTRLFGFDVLVSSRGQYFLVDANVFPGYKGVHDVTGRILEHLIHRAASSAIKFDFSSITSEISVRRLCAGTILSWKVTDDVSVTRLPSHLNCVFLVENRTRQSEPRSTVICRIFGPEKFDSRKGNSENMLVAVLVRKKLCASGIHNIEACYYGKSVHLGRIEDVIAGQTLAQLIVSQQDSLTAMHLRAICAHLGEALARLHGMLQDDELGRDVAGLYRSPHRSKLLSRARRWRAAAVLAVDSSQLRWHPTWQTFCGGFQRVCADMEHLIEQTNKRARSGLSMRIVLGHFDPTPANIIVQGSHTHPTGIQLIDFEWAGPNYAVYDFAKFVISMQDILDSNAHCSFTQADVLDGVRTMVQSYTRCLQTINGDKLSTSEEAQALLFDDILLYTPIVAAVNMFSNLRHASEAQQLHDIPNTAARWMDGGTFNWLAHAQQHLHLYDYDFSNATPPNAKKMRCGRAVDPSAGANRAE